MFGRRKKTPPLESVFEQIEPEDALAGRVTQIIPLSEEALAYIRANNYLAGYAKNIASQGGEDGVIEKILEILGISGPGWCVEFGACDGKMDSNTWNLVKNHGWKAVYIEPEPTFFARLEAHCKDTPDTWCFNAFVSWEGENKLDAIFARTPIPKDFDLMIVDIDGADYYVWEALEHYRPKVVCVEYHRLIHSSVHHVPPKQEAWNRPSSVKALYELGRRKGYQLIAVINWNAFFVRDEDFAKFAIEDNTPAAIHHTTEEMRIFQGYDGTLFLCGVNQHYWKYQRNEAGIVDNLKITHNDIQVLPEGLRVFRPRHTYTCEILEQQAGKLDAKHFPANALLEKRKNITSENGEDGILEFIFTTLGTTRGYCVDVGACDGMKWSNTRHLLANKKWKGLLVEADELAFKALAALYRNDKAVHAVHACVDSETTLESLLRYYRVPADFDFLNVDIEGNDYHLFASLQHFKPRVICIDFNPTIANDIRFVQENSERVHYGASLVALKELAAEKNYNLIAVTDWNAIFVRSDLVGRFNIESSDLDAMYKPPFEMRMFQTLDGCLHLTDCTTLIRQDYSIDWEDFQVLPRRMRKGDGSAEGFGKIKTLFYS